MLPHPPNQQPLLGHAPRQRNALTCPWSDIWYAIMFVFAPVPLDSFAAAVDVKSVFSRYSPRVPTYLSINSRISVYFIIVAAHLAFYTWIAQLASTLIVLASQPLPKTHLGHLALALVYGHLVLVARALGRKLIGFKIKRVLPPECRGTSECHFDIGFWTIWMVLYVLSVGCMLQKEETVAELRANGYFSQQTIDLTLVTMRVVLYIWVITVIMRIFWGIYARCLEDDFNRCMAYRILNQIPDVAYVEECAICLCESATKACQLPCGHVFHRACLEDWAATRTDGRGLSCPMCRAVPALTDFWKTQRL